MEHQLLLSGKHYEAYYFSNSLKQYPDCNGTYEEQKTEKYVGRTDGGKTAFG